MLHSGRCTQGELAMVEPTNEPRPLVHRWERAAGHPQARGWRRAIILAAALPWMIASLPSLAGEAAAGTDKPNAQSGEAGLRGEPPGTPVGEWSRMLQSLATSAERRELIGKLEAHVRQGDVAGAKQLLSAAV